MSQFLSFKRQITMSSSSPRKFTLQSECIFYVPDLQIQETILDLSLHEQSCEKSCIQTVDIRATSCHRFANARDSSSQMY